MMNTETKPSFGVISEVILTGNPTIANTRYKVKITLPNNYLIEIGPLTPSNRRPVDDPDFWIVPAAVGDVVGLSWQGGQVSCFILEGIVTEDCVISANRGNSTSQGRVLTPTEAENIRPPEVNGYKF